MTGAEANQTQAILAMLQERPITSLDALREAGCFRLAARIYDLKAQGHDIRRQMVTVNGKRVALYTLTQQTRLDLWGDDS